MTPNTRNNRKKRNRRLAGRPGESGAPFNDQDARRRLGNFVGAGEHARKGGRTTGVVGQTKQKSKTDQRKP